MDEQRYRFGVGVLVIASIVIGVILIMFFGAAPNFLARHYQVTVNFPAAPGVASDTPVRKNGVNIGRVKDVNLLEDDAGVDLVLELDSNRKVRQGELCRVGTGSLITGDAVVQFVPPTSQSLIERFDGRDGLPPDGQLSDVEQQVAAAYLKDEDYIKGGQVAPDPLESLVTMQEKFAPTLVAIEQAGNQVGALARDVRSLLGGGEGQIRQIVQKTEETMDNFNQTLDSIEAIFGDERLRASLQVAADRLPKLLDEAQGVLAETKETLNVYEGVGRAAEQAMTNVAEFTEPLGEEGDRIVADAVRTLNNLDGLVTDLRQVSTRLNSGQGTLNRLLNDDELYYSVQRTVQNLEGLTRRLQPIVEDVRVFTDKVARDPRQLGVAGAIQGRPIGTGLK
jgi:phospholipid/cholesterol/gamma-HCH transport system substrate-binding protein